MGTKHTRNISSLEHEAVSLSSSPEGKIPASVQKLFEDTRNSTAAVVVAAALTACGGGSEDEHSPIDDGPAHEVPTPSPGVPLPAPAPVPNLAPPPLELLSTAVREGIVGKTPVQVEDILRKAGFDQRITDILANSKNPNVQCQTHKGANGTMLTISVQKGIQTEEVATCELKGSGKYRASSSSQSRLEPNDQYGTISQTVAYSTFADTTAPQTVDTRNRMNGRLVYSVYGTDGVPGEKNLTKELVKETDGSTKHGFLLQYIPTNPLPRGYALTQNAKGEHILKWDAYAASQRMHFTVQDAAGNVSPEFTLNVVLETPYTPEPPPPPPPAPAPAPSQCPSGFFPDRFGNCHPIP